MSANLLDGLTPKLKNGTSAESDGTWHHAARTIATGHDDWIYWNLPDQAALETNQTYHVGLSTRGASANSASLHATIGYRDAAGNVNWANSAPLPIGTSWGRAEATIVVPSGMTPFVFCVAAYGTCPETWMASPTLSCGSPVTLASSAHTPYATQDHVMVTYATQASLKVTDDSIKAEVEERGKLAGRVDGLESTSSTHTSKLEQLATSIKSLVKGESTYTDPDGKSVTSGIYSLVTQTRDSVTALFGQYTKTDDLAATDAVKDAKKAGTDAQAAASAALTDAKAYTDSVEVGGRNLLKGSMSVATAPRTHGWYNNDGSPTVELVTLDGKECIHFSGSPSGTAIPSIRTRSRVLLEWDSVYVMTCDMMFDKEILIGTGVPQHCQFGSVENTDEFNLSVLKKGGGVVDVSYSPKAHEVIAANTWTRYTCVFKTNKTAPSDDYPYPTIAPFIYGHVRTVSETTEVNGWMRNFKIEKGTKATDWTPAPEDTDFAVADAKKAGTDAQAAASAAQSTADSAKSTAQTAASDAATAKTNAASAVSTANSASTSAANAVKTANAASDSAASAVSTANSASSTAGAAKSTADSLATMIREDATGITVGKSADGQTWSTGRTHMTADSFDVLDKAGNVLSSFGKSIIELGKNSANATISMLAGLVKIQARKDGSDTVASVSSDFLSLDSLWLSLNSMWRAVMRTGGSHASGYAAAITKVTGKRGTASLYCTQGDGFAVTDYNSFRVLPDGYALNHPEYLAAALLGTGGTGAEVTHSRDAVAMTSDLDACGPGVFAYDTSTTSRPTDCGTCVCIRAGDGTTSTWLFELALPTSGDPLWRRNINGAGWTSWRTITSQATRTTLATGVVLECTCGIAVLQVGGVKNSTTTSGSWNWVQIGTVPSAYLPKQKVYAPAAKANNADCGMTYIEVDTDGKVYLTDIGGSQTHGQLCYGTLSWVYTG